MVYFCFEFATENYRFVGDDCSESCERNGYQDPGKVPTYRARVDVTLASGANSLKPLLLLLLLLWGRWSG